ncbi:MAG: asparaginase [Planctomycetota bacterium]
MAARNESTRRIHRNTAIRVNPANESGGNTRARVLLLLTGGTLASTPDGEGTLAPSEFGDHLAEALPELRQVATVEARSLMLKDSSDIHPDDWRTIAEAVREEYSRFDGFVVVHGTDTMAYTASALSFLLPTVSKPVVFTGSQRPIFEPRSDARVNMVDSVTVATMAIPEVCVCMHSVLLRGNRCRKRSTIDYTAFDSPNCAPLAQLGVNVELGPEVLPPRGLPGLPLPQPLKMEQNVSVLFITPTTRPAEVRALKSAGARGLVLLAFGAGNVPVLAGGLADEIRALDMPCVALTQCFEGPVDLQLYSGGRRLAESGVIDGGDMTPEAALTKLMTGLGEGLAGDALNEYMTCAVAGERR